MSQFEFLPTTRNGLWENLDRQFTLIPIVSAKNDLEQRTECDRFCRFIESIQTICLLLLFRITVSDQPPVNLKGNGCV
jgi:hypothetical protein